MRTSREVELNEGTAGATVPAPPTPAPTPAETEVTAAELPGAHVASEAQSVGGQ